MGNGALEHRKQYHTRVEHGSVPRFGRDGSCILYVGMRAPPLLSVHERNPSARAG
jgi:hypothetical protein